MKSGAIKKFVVMAGCDGRAKSRDYYADFAKALPKDTVILTAGCAKYKYNKLWKAYEQNDKISIVLILMYSGVRIMELLDLKKEDVDFENTYHLSLELWISIEY